MPRCSFTNFRQQSSDKNQNDQNDKENYQKLLKEPHEESYIFDSSDSVDPQTQRKCVQILMNSLKTKQIGKPEKKKKPSTSQKLDSTEKNQKKKDLQQYYPEVDYQDSEIELGSVSKKTRNLKPVPKRQVLFCQQFKKIKQLQLTIYLNILGKNKVYSTMLINEFGQIIYADRLASQHFQGSLNNFERNPLQSMILECEKAGFYSKLAKVGQQGSNVLKILIYSKNSKRRYSKISKNSNFLTKEDIFNRYLKCLSLKIKPVEITVTDTSPFEGFWNMSLVQMNKSMNCYLLRSRLAMHTPKLENLPLMEDPKIKKFIKYTMKKQKQDPINAENLENLPYNCQNNFLKNSKNAEPILICTPKKQSKYKKMIDELQEEEEVKHSKTVLTRGCLLNSGGGKQKEMN